MVMEVEGPGETVTVRVWDLPIRVIHWALVGLIGFSWYSAAAGQMEWHRWSGYGVTALIVFRLIWGFAGSSTARFASFVRGPAAVGAALAKLGERRPASGIGHNPLGGWSVLALLLVLATQVISGLFAVDIDGLESGPLSDRVSFETGRAFAEFLRRAPGTGAATRRRDRVLRGLQAR
jgi:cytochrome b